MGGENLTIQLGHKANYLATHFWNSQVQASVVLC
jgi:Misato Segment II tubulin-like domain